MNFTYFIMKQELQYIEALEKILSSGIKKEDRTGVGTYSLFSPVQFRFKIGNEFPVLTSKKLYFKGVVHELLWMLSGDTNVKYLQENGVHIWDEWADENGDLNRVYGAQWRDWKCYKPVKLGHVTNVPDLHRPDNSVDQIQNVIDGLKNNPDSRRHIVSAWNPGELDQMALPPCHTFFQFYSEKIAGKRYLSCHLYQRSADMFLGVPFNIASYSLLTCMVAQVTDHVPYEFIHSFGDAHIYVNHVAQVREQISRKEKLYELPKLKLNPDINNIFDFKYEDIKLVDYISSPAIKAPIAV